MAERIVVSLRVPLDKLGPRQADRVRTMLDRAAASRAEVLGLSPAELLFGFAPDALEHALRLVLAKEPLEDGDTPFAAGVAQGDVMPLVEGRGIQWGTPIIVASALSSITPPGQVTVSEAL